MGTSPVGEQRELLGEQRELFRGARWGTKGTWELPPFYRRGSSPVPVPCGGIVPLHRKPKPFRVWRSQMEVEMARTYAGNPPDESAGWEMIGECDADGISWIIFSKAQNHSTEWRTYKVVAKHRAPIKANYWVVKNSETGQIGFARDYACMRSTRKELHAKVELIVSDYSKKKMK